MRICARANPIFLRYATLNPLINSYSQYAGNILDELNTLLGEIDSDISSAMEKKYADAIIFNKELQQLKVTYYHALINLSRYSSTRDETYLDNLRLLPIIPLQQRIKGKTRLSENDLLALHRILTERMNMLSANYEQVKPDLEEYRMSIQELSKITQKKSDAIREARLGFIRWGQAYGMMASGKTLPTEWFDVSKTPNLIFDSVTSHVR